MRSLIIQSQLVLALFFSGLLLSFSVFATNLDEEESDQLIKDIAKHHQWQNIVHAYEGTPNIEDHGFILSHKSFSLRNELEYTLDYFNNSPKKAMCRFPARYLFLSRFFSLPYDAAEIPKTCPELNRFLNYVPFNNLSLVYASEELASATSMMGHIFLRANGTNFKGNNVEHSIAFFTEINTFNPATLIYTGTVSGMEGLLLVKPFTTDAERYSKDEGRNLWLYDLNITASDRQLIQYHLWELKQTKITYLFQNYNCATLTLELLALAEPKLLQSNKLFVSPIDVVKAVKHNQLNRDESVLLASQWKLNMLQQQLSPSDLKLAEAAIYNPQLLTSTSNENQSPLFIEYLSTLIEQPHIESTLDASSTRYFTNWVKKNQNDKAVIDLAKYKNPAATKQDSQWGLRALISKHHDNGLAFNFVPASHQLYGDNTQYFSESSLKMGEITIHAYDDGEIKLDRLSLYDVQAYTPSTLALPVLSGAFYIGYHHIETSNGRKGVFELSAGIGKTYQISKDISGYAMLGAGLGINKHNSYLYVEPKIGAIVDLISNSKLIVEHKLTYNRLFDNERSHHSSAILSWNGATEKTFYLSLDSFYVNEYRNNKLSLGIDFHF